MHFVTLHGGFAIIGLVCAPIFPARPFEHRRTTLQVDKQLPGLLSERNETLESGVLLGCSEVLIYSVNSFLKVGVGRNRPNEALAGC